LIKGAHIMNEAEFTHKMSKLGYSDIEIAAKIEIHTNAKAEGVCIPLEVFVLPKVVQIRD